MKESSDGEHLDNNLSQEFQRISGDDTGYNDDSDTDEKDHVSESSDVNDVLNCSDQEEHPLLEFPRSTVTSSSTRQNSMILWATIDLKNTSTQ